MAPQFNPPPDPFSWGSERTNGHTNGHTNGNTNGHANGRLPGHGSRSLSVLVVDDEPAFCFAMSEILGMSGHQVHQANSVQQAMDILTQLTPDLILTDIMMPDIDGLSFIRNLRSQAAWQSIPTIAVSAKAMLQDRDAACQAGADGYLTKPFSAQDLQAAIRTYAFPGAAAA